MPKSKSGRPDRTPFVESEGRNGARRFRNSRYTVTVHEDADPIHIRRGFALPIR